MQEVKQSTPENYQSRCFALILENNGLRGCLEAVYRQVEKIKEVAEKQDFDGDLFICGTATNILGQINYMLGKEK